MALSSEKITSTVSQSFNNSKNESISSSNAVETTTQASLSSETSMSLISDRSLLSPPSMENKFSAAVTRLTNLFMEDTDLSKFSRTAHSAHAICQNEMADRKKVKEELLPHVFSGNPDAVDTFFKTHGTTFATLRLLITKVRFREGYQSQKFNQFICFREWRGVSPIQAAAVCGDVFFLDNLKKRIIGKYIDENQNLIEKNKSRLEAIRQEAIQQLEEVRSRISAQKIILEAATFVVDIYSDDEDKRNAAKLRLAEIQKSKEFQNQMTAFRSEMEVLRNQMKNLSEVFKTQQQKNTFDSAGPSVGADVTASTRISFGPMASISIKRNNSSAGDKKTTAETKASSENSQTTYADDTEFLAPVMNLIKAYINYLIQYPIFATLSGDDLCKLREIFGNSHIIQYPLSFSQSNWDELDKLWEIVGECHKRLPHYFKQEFFDTKPFSPLPIIENPPARKPCRFYNGDLLVLDGLGLGVFGGLFKGLGDGATLGVNPVRWPAAANFARGIAASDLLAVIHFYELRLTGLEIIIEQLRTPEIIENLDSHQSNHSPDVGAGPGL